MNEAQSIMSQSNVSMGSQTTSYAEAASHSRYPTEEQAIIMDSIDGLTVSDYVYAIADIIGAPNIHYVSRISLSRICMYLCSKEKADSLTAEENNKINIKGTTLEIRPLKTKTQRVIFSNVNPEIPNLVLIEKLRSFDIAVNNTMTPIKAGVMGEGFSHIRSFRRQIHLQPKDIAKLPNEFKVVHNTTTYHIYCSSEKIACFLCKKEGHIAKHCTVLNFQESVPIVNSQSQNIQGTSFVQQTNKVIQSEKQFPNLSSTTTTSENSIVEKQMAPPETSDVKKTPKRVLSSSNDSEKDLSKKICIPEKKNLNNTKGSNAKSKPDEILEKSVESFQVEIAESDINQLPINCEIMKDFISSSYGKPYKGSYDLAITYTNNIQALLTFLARFRQSIEDKDLKTRVTKLIKQISKRLYPGEGKLSMDHDQLSLTGSETEEEL